jgi:pyrroline-5-carboxylate reductase
VKAKEEMKIAFIGGGNMGEAMLSAILEKGLSTPEDISVSDINEACRKYIGQKFGVYTTGSNLEATARGDVVVLAIKPQNLSQVTTEIGGQLKAEQMVLSIIAGKSIATLQRGLKHHSIVRAMPNTPAQIGQGMTVWTATSAITEEQKASVSSILGAMGKEIYVDDEKYLDMATAVSGSGPAYVFLFMESLINAAVDIGLPPDTARELVLQTVKGSVEYAKKSDKELTKLREMVTSPGGTTAEALRVFDMGQFSEMVKQAVAAAYQRAKQLGD